MSKATYVQKGGTLDYPNTTPNTIEAGTVMVFGKRIGVIGGDIAPKTIGALHTEGVFKMEKADGEEISLGDALYYNNTVITKTETNNILAGYATETASSTQLTVNVKLSR